MVGIFTVLEPDRRDKFPTLFLTSSFRRGCRILYWVHLFLLKIRKTTELPSRSESVGLSLWLKLDQIFHFAQLRHQLIHTGTTTDKSFLSMNLTVMEGIILVSGRLRQKGVPLLHKDSLLAKLWLEHIHVNALKHAGGAATLKAESMHIFWVWKGTCLYKAISNQCITSIKQGSSSTPKIMAPLSNYRFQSLRPTAFEPTGTDFAGPWWTDQGRGPYGKDLPRKPRYLLVFACLTFRAIHLELTYGHSTEDVMEALQRFASRRAIPVHLISDNAKELKKASEVLAQCSKSTYSTYPIAPGWGEVRWSFSHPKKSTSPMGQMNQWLG